MGGPILLPLELRGARPTWVTWCGPWACGVWNREEFRKQRSWFKSRLDCVTSDLSLPPLHLRLPICEGIDPNTPSWAQPSGVADGGGLGCDDTALASSPLQESGLSAWISNQLHPLENMPPVLAVLLITSVIAFFTEFASNTATVIIFLPVLSELVRVLLGKRGRKGRAPVPSAQVRNLSPASRHSIRELHFSLFSSKMHESVRTPIFFYF